MGAGMELAYKTSSIFQAPIPVQLRDLGQVTHFLELQVLSKEAWIYEISQA